jgi:hypothetical protein
MSDDVVPELPTTFTGIDRRIVRKHLNNLPLTAEEEARAKQGDGVGMRFERWLIGVDAQARSHDDALTAAEFRRIMPALTEIVKRHTEATEKANELEERRLDQEASKLEAEAQYSLTLLQRMVGKDGLIVAVVVAITNALTLIASGYLGLGGTP